jgi:hypothetical protein
MQEKQILRQVKPYVSHIVRGQMKKVAIPTEFDANN